jgi:hypothetical protein
MKHLAQYGLSVTDCGQVWRKNKLMTTDLSNAGYLRVSFNLNGKIVSLAVHRLVATLYRIYFMAVTGVMSLTNTASHPKSGLNTCRSLKEQTRLAGSEPAKRTLV